MNKILVIAATEAELSGSSTATNVETLACGVGLIDAAISTTQYLIQNPSIRFILHVGIAGARRSSNLKHGDLVIGSSSLWCDTQHRLVYNSIAADPMLLATLTKTFPAAPSMVIGTSADVGNSRECDVEAMEGFGVLKAAQTFSIPAIEMRVISNQIEEPDRALWNFDLALKNLEQFLPQAVMAISSTIDE